MMMVTANKMATESHIVLIPNKPDKIPPVPAPIAKIRMIPKKCSDLCMAP